MMAAGNKEHAIFIDKVCVQSNEGEARPLCNNANIASTGSDFSLSYFGRDSKYFKSQANPTLVTPIQFTALIFLDN